MGNVIGVQCGDALVGRCWDCIAKKSEYICKLEDKLDALQAARDRLTEKRSDVNQINQQRPQIEQPEQVSGWLRRAGETIEEANLLLNRAEEERKKLCLAGCCSKNCSSSYRFGKSVARSLDRVNSLIAEEADLKQVVALSPAQQLELNLKEMEKEKGKLQALKEDLQARISLEEGPKKRTLEQVKLWLSTAETHVSEADQLILLGPDELNKLRGGDFSNFSFADKVAASLRDIVSLHSEGNFTEVTAKAVPPRAVERNLKPTVGTEEMLKEALSVLRHREVGVLGIYGLGGVGKTTLLKLINNHFAMVCNDFDIVIWVVVSKDLNLDNIENSIYKQIRSLDMGFRTGGTESSMTEYIFDNLKRKKFLLLLDDVWRQFDLEETGVPPTQRNGSKVVITSRSLDVCKQMEAKQTMKVKPLNQEEAWQLFKEKVGERDADILPVAQQVAKECCGLPIALVTIGRAMASRTTLEEWKYALQVLRRSVSNVQGMKDELYQNVEVRVFERLKFSYDSLPNDILQSCFLYCALFPEDFKILKDNLVRYWVAEKFCGRHEGYGILYTLIRHCLLEDEGECAKMHDVVRDMAVWITHKCEKDNHKFFTQAGARLIQLPEVDEWEGAKKVSFMSNSFQSIEGSPGCRDLVTLFLSHNRKLETISDGFFQFMTRLTILDLSCTLITELPVGITKLQSLEFLDLYSTPIRKLPIEMKNLVRLKYLNLEDNYCLKMIPVEVISSLSKLQVLNMFHCGLPDYGEVESNLLIRDGNMLVKELRSLKNLRELSLRVWDATFLHSICSNENLLKCLHALELHSLKDTVKSLSITSLANAKQLHYLDINFNEWLEELIIEEREIHTPGCSLVNNLLSFCGLREVNVQKNESMRHLTWLMFVPHLTILRVKANENMEEIISEEKLSEHQARDENSLNLFPKLQLLDLAELEKLKTICPEAQSFPCLTEINVRLCPALEKLPLNSKSAEGCNVVIRASEYWWNELTWEDNETRAAFSSCLQTF